MVGVDHATLSAWQEALGRAGQPLTRDDLTALLMLRQQLDDGVGSVLEAARVVRAALGQRLDSATRRTPAAAAEALRERVSATRGRLHGLWHRWASGGDDVVLHTVDAGSTRR